LAKAVPDQHSGIGLPKIDPTSVPLNAFSPQNLPTAEYPGDNAS